MSAKVILLSTLETKRKETRYLQDLLHQQGLVTQLLDLSLGANGAIWSSEVKLSRMQSLSQQVGDSMTQLISNENVRAVAGLGGGTGGELILQALRYVPFDMPKFLISTLPFDPRIALADSSVVVVPTLADIEGLNYSLRTILGNTAGMICGVCQHPANVAPTQRLAVGITALGATGAASKALLQTLTARGVEPTVFHANGYGGAAFARFVDEGLFDGIIDMTVHELTRLHLAGAHVAMPGRFSSANHLPRVVLPGGLNFIGLGAYNTLTPKQRARKHYRHTGLFTHIKVTTKEMRTVATKLAEALNAAQAPVHVIVPMGGFSHRDCPGGEIEDPLLREVAAERLEALAQHYTLQSVPWHINDPRTANAAIDHLLPLLATSKAFNNA